MRKEEKEELEAICFGIALLAGLFFIPYIVFVLIPNNIVFIIKSLKILGLILLFIIIHSMCHGGNSNER